MKIIPLIKDKVFTLINTDSTFIFVITTIESLNPKKHGLQNSHFLKRNSGWKIPFSSLGETHPKFLRIMKCVFFFVATMGKGN